MSSAYEDIGYGIVGNLLTIPAIVLLNYVFRFFPSRQLRFFGIGRDRMFEVYFGCIQMGDNFVGAGESAEARRYEGFFRSRLEFADDALKVAHPNLFCRS